MTHIVFRTDASQDIGSGHVVRCLSLAAALQARGARVSFICRAHPGQLCALIAQRGFAVRALAAPAEAAAGRLGAPWPDDAAQSIAALGELGAADWLVTDHYSLDHRWHAALRPHAARIMAIDDLADRRHDCDLLLDQNLAADGAPRYAGLVPPACTVLLGPRYALLQPPYAALHAAAAPRQGPVRRILLFFGGVDRDHLTERALRAVLALERPDLAVDVVAGAACAGLDAISALAAGQPQIRVHHALPSLAPLMMAADLAVGAGGATSWERLCLGLPCIVVTVADNQVPVTALLARRGLVDWLGDAGAASAPAMLAALRRWCGGEIASGWFPDYAELVDGRGVERVCAALMDGTEARRAGG